MKKEKIEDNKEANKAEETLSAIFDSVNDAIVLVDITGKITRMSKSVTDITKYTEEDLINKRLEALKFFTVLSLAKMLSNFVKTISGSKIVPYEVELVTKSGEKLFAEISGTPFRIKGKVVGVVAILRDITQRKKAEEELKEKTEELEKFNKLTIGREMVIIDLKKKIEELEKIIVK
jgi:PAS domain S-box-containing protein